jgi:iron uptake system component EfeO
VTTKGNRGWPPQRTTMAAIVAALALAAGGCASTHASGSGPGGGPAGGSGGGSGSGTASTVTVALTPQGCAPRPAKITAGEVTFNVANQDADAVTEAELRTADQTHILGEQENLTPGLSGAFTLDIQPGSYKINCPGASQSRWTLTVSGKAAGATWPSSPQLTAAVAGYSGYINQNVASLVTHSRAFCRAIDDGSMSQARLLYPKARVYYERIEPVAEIWGSLDTDIDGRWENPVTVASQFTGFHKLEQLLWEGNTLAGAPDLCAGLVRNEQQLLTLVHKAQYNPLEMASGATDLINEAATSKISGEEERYSNTDLPVFQANMAGAMKVVTLLQPYLRKKDHGLLALIRQRDAAITRELGKYKASPGYDGTGYVEYSTVLDSQRRQLAGAVNALAEAISKISVQVS